MAPSAIKQNILANYLGNIWTAVMGLVFIPLYLHFLGIEAYGLVGIFATLGAMFRVLDMGLSATLTRELPRLQVKRDSTQEMRDTVRTLEIIYWLVGTAIGIIVFLLAPPIVFPSLFYMLIQYRTPTT